MPSPLLVVRRLLIGAGILAALFTVTDYLFGFFSEPLKYAQIAVRSSERIRHETGGVVAVRLRWVWGFTYRTGYGNSTSSLDLHVVGAKRNVDLTLDLRQESGKWTVVRSTLPL